MRGFPNGRYVSGGKEIQFTCTECGHPKAYFCPSKGVGICHRCKHVYLLREGWERDPLPDILPPARRTNTLLSRKLDHPEVRDYLASRNLSSNHAWIIGWNGNRMVAPIIPIDGESPMETLCRHVDHGPWMGTKGLKKERYIFSPCPLEDIFTPYPLGKSENSELIVLVEGVEDALALYDAGVDRPAALLGSHLSKYHYAWLIMAARKVMVWMDFDEEGLSAGRRISEKLELSEIDVWRVVRDDPKFEGKDPASLSKDEIRWILRSSPLWMRS